MAIWEIDDPDEPETWYTLFMPASRLERDPNSFLRDFVQRELEEGLPWMCNELRLEERLKALADDDGMPAAPSI